MIVIRQRLKNPRGDDRLAGAPLPIVMTMPRAKPARSSTSASHVLRKANLFLDSIGVHFSSFLDRHFHLTFSLGRAVRRRMPRKPS